jgi:hypothetical protein
MSVEEWEAQSADITEQEIKRLKGSRKFATVLKEVGSSFEEDEMRLHSTSK